MNKPDPYQSAARDIYQECTAACERFQPFNSAHEAYAVLREELDEFWDAVKSNDPDQCRVEAAQLGAMCVRFLAEFPIPDENAGAPEPQPAPAPAPAEKQNGAEPGYWDRQALVNARARFDSVAQQHGYEFATPQDRGELVNVLLGRASDCRDPLTPQDWMKAAKALPEYVRRQEGLADVTDPFDDEAGGACATFEEAIPHAAAPA